tara:strand:+ start:1486 stop:2214 length:729 start_codon:yes stop_codon:yes gene_type:complete
MINLNGMMSPNNHMDRTMGAIAVGVIGGVVSLSQGAANRRQAEGFATEAKLERQKQEAALDKQKKEYKAMKFTNPFADMENTFEDLTVNQQQAQFQSQQGNQQRANIMQGLKGAAGGSGIAGLAQAMANQGQLQTQRISASIGMQESQNQMASAKGAAAIQASERSGDQYVQQQEADRQATLLGMQMGQTAGANVGLQQANANQMNASIANQQTTANLLGTLGTALGKADGGTDNNIFTPKT